MNLFLTFLIYSFIISTITIVFHFLISHSQHPHDLKPYEWELFVIQLHREIKESSNVSVSEEELLFTNKSGQEVSINQYKNLIRRQVLDKGHEILLLRVTSVSFQLVESGVQIKVVSEAGKDYTYIFRTFKDLVEA